MSKFGKYRLLTNIGLGGMAEICLAKEEGLGGFERFVVIKKILSHYANDDKFIKMFFDEAKLAAQLSHPNIVQIIEFGKQKENYFLAMEYIAGADIEKIMSKTKIPIEFCCEIIAQAAEGLHYAHTKTDIKGESLHIVHRDVSPQNILVNYSGKVKIVDFGIAKATSQSNKTRTGVVKGKLSYMSPEYLTGKGIDHRSDIFALGVLLYEMTTGKRLFKADSEFQVIKMIVECNIEAPESIIPNYPEELSGIIAKALQPDVEKRYQTAHELRIALKSFLKSFTSVDAVDTLLSTWMKETFKEEIESFQNEIIEIQKNFSEVEDKKELENNLLSYMGNLINNEKTVILEENQNSTNSSSNNNENQKIINDNHKKNSNINISEPINSDFDFKTVILDEDEDDSISAFLKEHKKGSDSNIENSINSENIVENSSSFNFLFFYSLFLTILVTVIVALILFGFIDIHFNF
ncbi:serine/threonine protein kinase [bacterium]|nr:serine/threonine protein kinase [bacterium]